MNISRLKGRQIVDAYEDNQGVDCLVLDDGTVIEDVYIAKLSPEDQKVANAAAAAGEVAIKARRVLYRLTAIEDSPTLAEIRSQVNPET